MEFLLDENEAISRERKEERGIKSHFPLIK